MYWQAQFVYNNTSKTILSFKDISHNLSHLLLLSHIYKEKPKMWVKQWKFPFLTTLLYSSLLISSTFHLMPHSLLAFTTQISPSKYLSPLSVCVAVCVLYIIIISISGLQRQSLTGLIQTAHHLKLVTIHNTSVI